jgi:hypothetical protein
MKSSRSLYYSELVVPNATPQLLPEAEAQRTL